MKTPRVKICGITSVGDALHAQAMGADAIGLVFYENSKRVVSIEVARKIARAVGPFVTVVGLFVDADAAFITQVLKRVPLHLLQFHGNETTEFCEQFARPYIKALRMKPDVSVEAAVTSHPEAVGILLDAYIPGVPGGTGEAFDWQRVPSHLNIPIVLAGGLTPDNVGQAVEQTACYGVDVSGGVESKPGIKDQHKVKQFIINAKTGIS